ncbi:MAG: ABC transporter substrate-binding protein [Anaerolineae bacterium]|nr:ABC transporter substrate-binding protein [Anaerolineae bacterium]
MFPHKRYLTFVLLSVTVLAMITACGTSSTDSAETPAAKSVTIGLGSEPPNLDPRNYNYTAGTFAVAWQIFEPLVYHDTRTDKLIPGLAESWEQIDPTTYEFKLREGVTWHDGEPFTADDVAWTLTRGPRPIQEFVLNPEQPVEVVDDYTIRVYTANPIGYFMVQSIALNLRIMPKHILAERYTDCQTAMDEKGLDDEATGEVCTEVEKNQVWTENVVGTGPFKLQSWEPGVNIVLAANPDYWGGAPKIDELVFKWVEEEATRIINLESGEYDLILGVPDTDIERLEGEENITVLKSPGYGYDMITLNEAVPALADARIRQAIAYAVDKEALMKLFPGVVTRTCGPLSTRSSFYNNTVNCYNYDPDQAKALLAEAGWDPATHLTLKAPPDQQNEAQLIQRNLQDVGIDVELLTVESGAYYQEVRDGQSELALYGFSNIVDPDHMYWVFHKNWILGQASAYQNDTVSSLLEQGQTVTDQEQRRDIYNEAQQMIVDEDAVAVFLYSHDDVRAYRSDRLTGLEEMPLPTDVVYWLRSADVVE